MAKRNSTAGVRHRVPAPKVTSAIRGFTSNDHKRLADLQLCLDARNQLQAALPLIRMAIGDSVVVADVKLVLKNISAAADRLHGLLLRLRDAELDYVEVAKLAYGWARYVDEHTEYEGDDETGREVVFVGDEAVAADDLIEIINADMMFAASVSRAAAEAALRDQGRVRSGSASWISLLDSMLRGIWANCEPDVPYPFPVSRYGPFAEVAAICYQAAMGLSDREDFTPDAAIRSCLATRKRLKRAG